MMNKRHGHARNGNTPNSRTYQAWSDMKRRCKNPNHSRYADYGGRGITVCSEWDDFMNFLSDMGEAPRNMTLDRKENSSGYCKDNCRWISLQEQQRNRRDTISITYQGETLCVAEWERRLNFSRGTVLQRLHRGWSTEKALSAPVGRYTRWGEQ